LEEVIIKIIYKFSEIKIILNAGIDIDLFIAATKAVNKSLKINFINGIEYYSVCIYKLSNKNLIFQYLPLGLIHSVRK
jgi:hypothetical protein